MTLFILAASGEITFLLTLSAFRFSLDHYSLKYRYDFQYSIIILSVVRNSTLGVSLEMHFCVSFWFIRVTQTVLRESVTTNTDLKVWVQKS